MEVQTTRIYKTLEMAYGYRVRLFRSFCGSTWPIWAVQEKDQIIIWSKLENDRVNGSRSKQFNSGSRPKPLWKVNATHIPWQKFVGSQVTCGPRCMRGEPCLSYGPARHRLLSPYPLGYIVWSLRLSSSTSSSLSCAAGPVAETSCAGARHLTKIT